MKLKIEITMDNAAFGELNGAEAARILREYANSCYDWQFVGGEHLNLRDINGNKVGTAEVVE